MKTLFLSVKRCLRTVYFPVLLCVLAALIALVPALGKSESHPPAGFCDLDGSLTTERISDYLTDMGLVRCETEAELYDGISSGKLDCGFVFENGFEDLLLSNSLDGVIPIITSPMTYSQGIWRNHVAAAVFTELAPVISTSVLPDSVDLADEIGAEYHSMIEAGSLFSFRIEALGTDQTATELRSISYVRGTAAILIFTLMMYAVCDVLRCDAEPLVGRIGAWKTTVHLILPDLVVRALGICIAIVLGAILSCETAVAGMIPALIVFTLLCTAFAIFAGAVILDGGVIRIFTFFMIVGALVICPITFDATIMLPWLSYVRSIFPPYWLWICCDDLIIAAVMLILLPASVAALAWRLKRIKK